MTVNAPGGAQAKVPHTSPIQGYSSQSAEPFAVQARWFEVEMHLFP
jgi:hypothetical protein